MTSLWNIVNGVCYQKLTERFPKTDNHSPILHVFSEFRTFFDELCTFSQKNALFCNFNLTKSV